MILSHRHFGNSIKTTWFVWFHDIDIQFKSFEIQDNFRFSVHIIFIRQIFREKWNWNFLISYMIYKSIELFKNRKFRPLCHAHCILNFFLFFFFGFLSFISIHLLFLNKMEFNKISMSNLSDLQEITFLERDRIFFFYWILYF